MMYKSRILLPLLISSLLALSACHEEDVASSDNLNPYVDEPAYATLQKEGSFHIFSVTTFQQGPTPAAIRQDIMVLGFNNFGLPSTNHEPDKDESATINDLKWTQDAWDEASVKWAKTDSPKSTSPYNKTRQYRIFKDDNLEAPVTTLNYPIYEAIDENVYERQLGATFVWDIGKSGLLPTADTGEKVGGKKMTDYKTLYGYDVLPYVDIWGDKQTFSANAVIYGATFSVATDTFVIEAVDNAGSFSLAKTKFGTGQADIETALLAYPQGGARLEYAFTLNYSKHASFFMSFDTISKKAYLYPNATGSGSEFPVSYTLKSNPTYLEIDTSALTESERIILGKLPTYFKPIIVGPFTDDGSTSNDSSKKSFFYGKHYIKTDALSRLKLDPVFILNPAAKTDVETAFKAWRDKRHLEEGI